MKRSYDHTTYGDTIDGDRLRASPRAIVASWAVILVLMALGFAPSLLATVETGVIAAARAAYLDLRHAVARAPATPAALPADKSCS